MVKFMSEFGKLFQLDDDDPSDEGLDDLRVGPRSLASSVVYNTDWTVETVTRQVEKGAIDLTPSFQRRDAWTPAKKSLLIESILLNFPVPPLTLAEVGATKSYIVVDGKQRLTTLSQFFGFMPGSRYNKFKLVGLKELPELNTLNIDELYSQQPDYFRALENYSIRTNVIRGWHKDDVLYSIFLRLNSGSVKLSPQELRQALNPGPFSDWLSEHTANSEALRDIFSGPEPDFRMRDLELMIRYLGMHFFLIEYRGDLKKFLDGTARQLNEGWSHYEGPVIEMASVFENAYKAVVEVFGRQRAFRKWSGDRWESRLNRAVFDVMMYYLMSNDIIDKFRSVGNGLAAEFQSLCDHDVRFREAIESTTKSIDAVATRLGRWGWVLHSHGITDCIVGLDQDGELILNAQA